MDSVQMHYSIFINSPCRFDLNCWGNINITLFSYIEASACGVALVLVNNIHESKSSYMKIVSLTRIRPIEKVFQHRSFPTGFKSIIWVNCDIYDITEIVNNSKTIVLGSWNERANRANTYFECSGSNNIKLYGRTSQYNIS